MGFPSPSLNVVIDYFSHSCLKMCKICRKCTLDATFLDCLALTFCEVIGELLTEWACLTLQGGTLHFSCVKIGGYSCLKSEKFQWVVRLRTSCTLPLFFIMTTQLQCWKHYEAQVITYDIIMKNNGKVRDVRSLACKIKVLNGHVPGTWKWTIATGLPEHKG